MPVVGMSGLDGRSARRDAVGSGRKETNPKGGSVTKKRSKIQQSRRDTGHRGQGDVRHGSLSRICRKTLLSTCMGPPSKPTQGSLQNRCQNHFICGQTSARPCFLATKSETPFIIPRSSRRLGLVCRLTHRPHMPSTNYRSALSCCCATLAKMRHCESDIIMSGSAVH